MDLLGYSLWTETVLAVGKASVITDFSPLVVFPTMQYIHLQYFATEAVPTSANWIIAQPTTILGISAFESRLSTHETAPNSAVWDLHAFLYQFQ